MNSEELEKSLRTEFESYLKDVFAEMKQEVADFQTKVVGEMEKHKNHLDEVFGEFSTRFENEKLLDPAFKDSIIEHLRLSRDEGARITATAIAEAEEMQKQADDQKAAEAVQPANYSELRDAVQDISEKDSQSSILKALVGHAAQFTPRGAFFIIKNEHFVGWRVFGKEGETDEQTVREVFFPVSSDTVLGESVRSLSPVETTGGTYTEDSLFLNKLDFGHPGSMVAIPLVARQRGVAVLYADHGSESEKVNVEALETLVRVAGMTVELLAAAQTVKSRQDIGEDAESSPKIEENQVDAASTGSDLSQTESEVYEESYSSIAAMDSSFENNFAEESKPFANYDDGSAVNYSEAARETAEPESFAVQDEAYPTSNAEPEKFADEPEISYTSPSNFETIQAEAGSPNDFDEAKEKVSDYPWKPAASESGTDKDFVLEPTAGYEIPKAEETSNASSGDFEFSSYDAGKISTEPAPTDFKSSEFATNEFQSPQFETSYNDGQTQEISSPQFETPAFEPNDSFAANKFESSYESFAAPAEKPAPIEAEKAAPAPTKTRLSERNVDLPIEVAEDERRPHNDARRFARLLVSEIKLYNEQKVKEGREAGDLYDRLREAIDRSREMYDKRVQSPVAAKFDYFNYELVNNLAEGDQLKLGGNYPGAAA